MDREKVEFPRSMLDYVLDYCREKLDRFEEKLSDIQALAANNAADIDEVSEGLVNIERIAQANSVSIEDMRRYIWHLESELNKLRKHIHMTEGAGRTSAPLYRWDDIK